MTIILEIFATVVLFLILGGALYLLYGVVLGGVTITRLIFKGMIDLLTLKSLRQELRKFRN